MAFGLVIVPFPGARTRKIFLYVGDSPANHGEKRDEMATPATRNSRRITRSYNRALNTLALALAFALAAMMVFFSYS